MGLGVGCGLDDRAGVRFGVRQGGRLGGYKPGGWEEGVVEKDWAGAGRCCGGWKRVGNH